MVYSRYSILPSLNTSSDSKFTCCEFLLRHQERWQSIVMSTSVCVCVCPRAYLLNHTCDLYPFFYACCLWLWHGLLWWCDEIRRGRGICSFVNVDTGQGSSLLWTPAMRPLCQSNVPAQGEEGNW